MWTGDGGMKLEGQWEQRILRGEEPEFVRQEIKDMMVELWENEKMPYSSADDLEKYVKDCEEEIKIIAKKYKEEQEKERSLYRQLRKTKQKHAQKEIKQKLADFEHFWRGSTARLSGKEYIRGYAADLEEQSDFNKRRLKILKINFENAQLVEIVFKGLKKKLKPEEYAEIWYSVVTKMKDPDIGREAFEGLMDWLEDTEETQDKAVDTEQMIESYVKKIKFLSDQFMKTYDQLQHAEQAGRQKEETVDSAEHARFILRTILKFLEKIKIGRKIL